MDYKEKLRLAKEALESGSYDKDTIEYIFPELAESEDERIRKGLIGILSKYKYYYSKEIAWLKKQGKPSDEEMKTLLRTEYEKGRADAIAEMQKGWSEEDEKYVKDLANYFTGGLSLKHAEEDIADWLKSLKGRVQPQNGWKPSDEKVEALKGVQEGVFRLGILESLYQDLKKLKEE